MNHIFYHNDPDGWCSAAIVRKYLLECNPITAMGDFHECRYGMEFPWDAIAAGDTVYMVDFSLKQQELVRLKNSCREFVFIDHHQTALEEVAELAWDSPGILAVGKGACELTWEYMFPDKPMPRAVHLISMYDVWKLKEEPYALPFQYGIKTVKRIADPGHETWADLLEAGKCRNGCCNTLVTALLKRGWAIKLYQDECNAQICARAAFETELDVTESWRSLQVGTRESGQRIDRVYKAIACTSPMCNSMLFDSVWDPEKHDIMLSFYWDSRGHWTVSVYSTKEGVDCAAIAKSIAASYGNGGGGGHKGAAGAQVKTIDWIFKHAEKQV